MPAGYGSHRTAFKDLSGKQFGHWKVLSRGGTYFTRIHWWCECQCGEIKQVSGAHLRSGASTNCGCIKFAPKDNTIERHPLQQLYYGMIARCEQKSHRSYKDYGARGIKVCSRWRNDFWAFVADMGDRPSSTHSVDRINTNGNYEPSNCRWATPKEQAQNKRKRKAA